MKILIKNNHKEQILETNDKNYKDDIQNCQELTDVWWKVYVEYHTNDEKSDNLFSKTEYGWKRVVVVNNRGIFANYNLPIDGHRDIRQELIKCMDEDFLTNNIDKEIAKFDASYKKWEKETNAPVNKHLSPEKADVPTDLIDDE